MKFSINKSYMKLIEYYLNIFHYVIYVYCIKYKRFLPGYSPSHNSGNILMILTVIPSIIIFNRDVYKRQVRSLVISDYQEELEKEWVKSLRQKYSVVVNPEVLATVNKH